MSISPVYFLTLERKGEVKVFGKEFAEELAKQAKAEIFITKDTETNKEIYIVLKPVEYDSSGRMKYNPRFHKKGIAWSSEDLQYLIEWYDIIGPEEMSFALERPATSIMQRVSELRRKGVMKKPKKITHFRRIKKEMAL